MDKAQAVHAFWSGFEWPAYDESTVPENAPFPRIVYQVQTDSFENAVSLSASLWDRSTSWERISLKSDEIARKIVKAFPPSVKIDGGRMIVTKGRPFASRMTDPDTSLRRIVLNVEFEFLTNY